MSTSRNRAVSSASLIPELINALSASLENVSSDLTSPETSELNDQLQQLRHLLVDSNPSKRGKEAFRRAGGFEVLLRTLTLVSTALAERSLETHARTEQFGAITIASLVLSEALSEHPANQLYFSSTSGINGWDIVELELSKLILGFRADAIVPGNDALHEVEILFGLLFAVILCEDSFVSSFKTSKTRIGADTTAHMEAAISNSLKPSQNFSTSAIAGSAKPSFKSTDFVRNPQAVSVLFKIWWKLYTTHDGVSAQDISSTAAETSSELLRHDTKDFFPQSLSTNVISALADLVKSSEFNVVEIHRSNVLRLALEALFTFKIPEPEASELESFATELLKLGINNLSDASYFFEAAQDNSVISNKLLAAIQLSRQPSHFVFDLSMGGFASLEFAQLSGPFPPLEPSHGYTLSAWIYVHSFDDACHTTIFGAFDEGQVCFVLVYLELRTHQIVLQTSISSQSPSVRFKSVVFEKDKWYHIVLMHQFARATKPSRASLFVNGRFMEERKCQYPEQPRGESQDHHRHAQSTSRLSAPPVQCFFGTPHDLSPRLGSAVLSSKWTLASAQLFGELLSEELLLVFFHLGPLYHGNFQDALGSFQTYKASTQLNLLNEEKNGPGAENSKLANTVKLKASKFNPERTLLVNISPFNVIPRQDQRYLRIATPKTRAVLESHFQGASNDLVVNSSVPLLTKALMKPFGFGSITGGTVLFRPLPLEECCWRLSGCVPTGIQLVAKASKLSTLLRATEIFLELVRESWRNSEAIERRNGFGLLAWVMRAKLFHDSSSSSQLVKPLIEVVSDRFPEEPGSVQALFSLVLRFLGVDLASPEKALLNNPLGYRQLVVDCNIWERLTKDLQILYFTQFAILTLQSQYRNFNARRLTRMRIVKKLLEFMKERPVDQEVMPALIMALRCMLESNLTAENLRSVALYIAFSLTRDEKEDGRIQLKLTDDASPNTVTSAERGACVLEMLADLICEDKDNGRINKFARTITTKWLLNLLALSNSRVTSAALKILVRALTSAGANYLSNFQDKDGFLILRRRLPRSWSDKTIWMRAWQMLLGSDVPIFDHDGCNPHPDLLRTVEISGSTEFYSPEMGSVLLAMIGEALKDRLSRPTSNQTSDKPSAGLHLEIEGGMLDAAQSAVKIMVLLHGLKPFRNLSTSHHFTRDLLAILFEATKYDSIGVQDTTEMQHRHYIKNNDSPPTDSLVSENKNPNTNDTLKLSNISPVVTDETAAPLTRRRRTSSFVMIRSDLLQKDSIPLFDLPLEPTAKLPSLKIFQDSLCQQCVQLLVCILADQIINNSEFSGLGLFLKAPPETTERRSRVNSMILAETLDKLSKDVAANLEVLHEPKTLMNITRFSQQTYEALLEGWFLEGSQMLLDFLAIVLGHLNEPAVRAIKVVRLCSPSIIVLQGLFRRLMLFNFLANRPGIEEANITSHKISSGSTDVSGNDSLNKEAKSLQFIQRQLDLLVYPDLEGASSFTPQLDSAFFSALVYAVCRQYLSDHEFVRTTAFQLLKELVSRKPREIRSLANQTTLTKSWSEFVNKIACSSDDTHAWLVEHRDDIESVLNESPKLALVQFVDKENAISRTLANTRLSKREDRLNQRHLNELTEDHSWTEHKSATKTWAGNIYTSEVLKHLRAKQDYQDSQEYFASLYRRTQEILFKQTAAGQTEKSMKWSLDETEGRSRMRLRLLPSKDAEDLEYRPKRRQTISVHRSQASPSPSPAPTGSNTPRRGTLTPASLEKEDPEPDPGSSTSGQHLEAAEADEFELIHDNSTADEESEDKNRKVMRSLQRGEKVHDVYNVSQIRGLEAVETLLIIGEKSLYLLSNLFQRQDGEIVNVWQAPKSERDPYTQMITGREVKRPKKSAIHDVDTGTRNWLWSEIISISKRRFLSRPVAIEIFFQDGRSYLLTAMSEQQRNKLYNIIFERAVKLRLSASLDEDYWRIELLPNPRETSQTVGSRLANAFHLGSILPATTRWVKGEISNFQYLMLVNTMAGRTFNDLTQYPVFPWVIADYSSTVLDLNNPKTYRDLTKPMGCQNSGREDAFKERFKAFADMSEHTTPAFHYGTHYSTAMIVTSYLIRLQPFVDAYLLLQGGNFDHADRLFYSIEKAWLSASQETMTDVRELTPEFFYLPDFLKNINGYDFGQREANGEKINNVILPPWAHGDPELFIAKNREALESPFVSQNLHNWIDLVFGFKQRGEAAIEAVNVFHHLSYQDATNLDIMNDLHERLATIGIIHNFGQTPSQIFLRPHERRESSGLTSKKLHRLLNSLSRLPEPIYEHHSQISQLEYSTKQQRLLCCGPWRTFMTAKYNVVMDWAHSDMSVRFYNSETKKIMGLCEQLHQDIITAAKFVDKTLITASYDCTVGVWNMVMSSDNADAQQRGVLFAHRDPVTSLSVSKPLSTILSGDTTGRVLLWDLNSLDLVREINLGREIQCAQINNVNGHILFCCGRRVLLYTLNGTLLLDQVICGSPNDHIYCSSFYENTGNEFVDTELIFTGHRWGVVNAWKLVARADGSWKLELVRRFDHVDRSTTEARNLDCPITAVCPLDHVVYTGDEEGRVFEWACTR